MLSRGRDTGMSGRTGLHLQHVSLNSWMIPVTDAEGQREEGGKRVGVEN